MKVSKRTKKNRGPDLGSSTGTMVEEVVIDEGSTAVDELEQEMIDAEAQGSGAGAGLDDGLGSGLVDDIEIDEVKDAHDRQAVTSVRMIAIEAMKDQGVLMSAKEEKDALGLFPKVCLPYYSTIRSDLPLA